MWKKDPDKPNPAQAGTLVKTIPRRRNGNPLQLTVLMLRGAHRLGESLTGVDYRRWSSQKVRENLATKQEAQVGCSRIRIPQAMTASILFSHDFLAFAREKCALKPFSSTNPTSVPHAALNVKCFFWKISSIFCMSGSRWTALTK